MRCCRKAAQAVMAAAGMAVVVAGSSAGVDVISEPSEIGVVVTGPNSGGEITSMKLEALRGMAGDVVLGDRDGNQTVHGLVDGFEQGVSTDQEKAVLKMLMAALPTMAEYEEETSIAAASVDGPFQGCQGWKVKKGHPQSDEECKKWCMRPESGDAFSQLSEHCIESSPGRRFAEVLAAVAPGSTAEWEQLGNPANLRGGVAGAAGAAEVSSSNKHLAAAIRPKEWFPEPLGGDCDMARSSAAALTHIWCRFFCSWGLADQFAKQCYFLPEDTPRSSDLPALPATVNEVCKHAQLRPSRAGRPKCLKMDCAKSCLQGLDSDEFQTCCGVKNVWHVKRDQLTGMGLPTDKLTVPQNCTTDAFPKLEYAKCVPMCEMAKKDASGNAWNNFFQYCYSATEYFSSHTDSPYKPSSSIGSFGNCDKVVSNAMGIANWVCTWACSLGDSFTMKNQCAYKFY